MIRWNKTFVCPFKGIFISRIIGSQDLLIEESIPGLEKLKEMLSQIKSDEEKSGYGLKAALTKNFIRDVEKIVKKMKEESDKMENSKSQQG